MQTLNSLDISLYIGLATLFALALIWWVYTLGFSEGRTSGYDEGWAADRRAHHQRVEALHEDLALLHGKLAELDAKHLSDRESIMQDADTRIAIYSRRANPLTRDDAKWLRKVSGQLQLLATMHHNLANDTAENWAYAAIAKANNLAALVDEALDAAEPVNPQAPSIDSYLPVIEPTPEQQRLAQRIDQHIEKRRNEAFERVAAQAAEESTRPRRSVLVQGPEGCGKTRNSKAIAAALGLTDIRDDWNPGVPINIWNTLHLTNPDHSHKRFSGYTISYDQAMELVLRRAEQESAA
ncbi:hypothetical protein QYE80_27385 [Pseudomonas tohonis]|nr:hypothetical protein L682_11140 [Pseudomonas alcaligenes OT 69]MDN4148728.1 hypothetical protein [Pseudomonas tohonis]